MSKVMRIFPEKMEEFVDHAEPDPNQTRVNFTEALKLVHDSPRPHGRSCLMASPITMPSDAIIWDSHRGWRWLVTDVPVQLMHPSIVLGEWRVGETPKGDSLEKA